MAKKTPDPVAIIESELTNWGVAEHHANMLVRRFTKLGRFDLADMSKAILDETRRGFDVAYEERKNK